MKDIRQKTIDTIRVLSAETIEKAKSGHPGTPLGAAPAAYTLWENMRIVPKNPDFPDRDRFVLSAGHGSALLYTLLHLFGYGLTVEDLQQFRQHGSLTPGHPEYHHTKGVEITTGPLGQGIANAVGMAIAEARLAAEFNKSDCELVNHFTYALCGDGCMMEGISGEAASLAGTLSLGKLVVLYDSNNITIEGNTDIAFREDVGARFTAYGWHVQKLDDGNDTDAIKQAIELAKSVTDKPSLIEIKTQIGFGAPNKQGKPAAHGEPLGADELVALKKNLGFEDVDAFCVPEDVKAHMQSLQERLNANEDAWNELLATYAKKYPEDYQKWQRWHTETDALCDELCADKDFWTYEGDLATRSSSEAVLNKLCKHADNLLGGAADLAPSTKSLMKGRGDFSAADYSGSNMHFGVREHAMAAIANGIAVHGGLRPYVAGFFVFSDYMKPSMRLAAMMKLPVVYIMTHDSIGVGEDGPTHQPIEQLAMLRSIPNFTVIRPCDTNETAAAWYLAMRRTESPTALILSRQNLTLLAESSREGSNGNVLRGGYILKDSKKQDPDMILIASGSEVELVIKAQEILAAKGIDARVVSMMSMEVFEEQDEAYRNNVLPRHIKKRVAVEAGITMCWHKYVGDDGEIIGIDHFGASAPYSLLLKEFGFTAERVAEIAERLASR